MKTFTQAQVKVFLDKWGIEPSHLRSNHALLDDEEYAEVLSEHIQDKLHGKLIPKSLPMYSEEDKEILEYTVHVNSLDYPKWILEVHREALEKELHTHCKLFCTIGFPQKSPRWINIHDVEEREFEGAKQYFMVFMSTQTHLGFEINISERFYKTSRYKQAELWEAFKQFRTTFLVANYPTIKTT